MKYENIPWGDGKKNQPSVSQKKSEKFISFFENNIQCAESRLMSPIIRH